MNAVFNYLYDIHPLLPAAYFVLLVVGFAAPPLYCVLKDAPVSLKRVWSDAAAGSALASFAKYSYLTLCVASIVVIVAVLLW